MIAAVTNYYNPSHRKIKGDNFIRFREGLSGIPLYIVEAAFGNDSFSLPQGPNVTQVRCRDTIWQQYRLINLAIRNLPDQFDKVVWIDADILFESTDWIGQMDKLLDQYQVIQNYSKVNLLTVDGRIGETKIGVACQALENSKNPLNRNFSSCLDMAARFATGFSWGVRRDLIESHGIYDYWITGSSDNAFVLGIWGDWKNNFIKDRLNIPMTTHFMEWAVPFHNAVGGKVSYIDQTISHLWHGQRNYKKRWNCLRNFDPYHDIKIADNGVFEWSSDNNDLHDCCRTMCLNYDVKYCPLL